MMPAKYHPASALVGIVTHLRQVGKRVVFTNGCFDILHPGHVHTLTHAKAQGDVLIVGINSDASVKRLKGERRPILSQDERVVMLAALAAVDYVTIFEEDTPLALIQLLRPHVLVKGGDWNPDAVVGREIVEANGGKVVVIPYREGLSTTGIIERIVAAYQGSGTL
jgi:D-beta-D-heptose 7-phosphate kinase/D-beta-D-heptose 1-phosphate adenosyltransferase